MLKYALLGIVICNLLISCASNPRIETLSAFQRSRLESMEIFKGGVQKEYAVLGTVSGLSCNRNKYQAQDITYDEALQGVKIKAVLMNADAVINTFCQKNSDTDWINNCWASIKCIGDAIKYK
jgi:hypothetical protein